MARVSLTPEVIDGIVAGLRARAGWRGPDDSTEGTTVYDGPEFTTTDATHPDGFVVIGYGGEDLDDREGDPDDAMSGEVNVAAMATTSPKDVSDEIECAAWFGLGSVDVSGARSAVFAIVDDFDTWLRANARATVAPGSGAQVNHVQVTGTSLRQYIRDGGSRASVRFTIRLQSRT